MFLLTCGYLVALNSVGSVVLYVSGPGLGDALWSGVLTLFWLGGLFLWLRGLTSRLQPTTERYSRAEVRDVRKQAMSAMVAVAALTLVLGAGMVLSFGMPWLLLDPRWTRGLFVASVGIALLATSVWILRRNDPMS
jgi:hypothetical protein